MELPEIAEFARNFAAMVRIQGPDPKGLKMKRHAFHLHHSGSTTLSASGLFLPPGSLSDSPQLIDHICSINRHSGAVVVTTASVIEPFLIAQQRNNPTQEFSPKLITGAHVDVLVEGINAASSPYETNSKPCWLPSQLLALVDVSASSLSLLSLVGVQNGSTGHTSWEVGWSLSPLHNSPEARMDTFQGQVQNDSISKSSFDGSSDLTLMAKLSTRIAFLGVSMVDLKDVPNLEISQQKSRGDLLVALGSPFGVLSPLHFLNSISIGAVANFVPSDSSYKSLLMADIRCLPGMEGGPIFDRHACLTGILTTPLRQKGSDAEIQLVITWDAIANSWDNMSKKEARKPQGGLIAKSAVDKAISSIVLVTVGAGVWASGIILNTQGLILTNAHIMEPWRFGRTSLLGLEHGDNSEKSGEVSFSSQYGSSSASVSNGNEAALLDSNYRSYRRISVRLDYDETKLWTDARVVYISRGVLDIALLQLESVPDQLCAITSEFSYPLKGSTVHVIGHGLLGPRSEIFPSVSSGVLASVVSIPEPFHLHESRIPNTGEQYTPVMLQTTAGVHPGASGGAVVNSDGRMIGLVTSNARHGGGAIIPHMNFSIPCSALEPIFMFSDKRDPSILQVLDKPNEILSSVWALTPPPPSPNMHSKLDKENKDGRGSRFSKFLSEKQADFNSLNDQERLTKEKLPSKM